MSAERTNLSKHRWPKPLSITLVRLVKIPLDYTTKTGGICRDFILEPTHISDPSFVNCDD